MFTDTAMMTRNNLPSDPLETLLRVSENNTNAISRMTGFMETTSQYLADFSDRLGNFENRMFNIENNEEVTTDQVNNIHSCASRRIKEILSSPLEYMKYFRIFYSRMWYEARKYVGLANSINRTPKRNYQNVIEFIEAWVPDCGIANLKGKADENARMRKQARDEGY